MVILKKSLLVIILLFILAGCKQQSKFTLLFTSDYAYGKDKSYLISYDEVGDSIETKEIEGALFYNLLNYKNIVITDNGFVKYSFSDNTTSLIEYENFKGYLEPNYAFVQNNIQVSIYNYGSNGDGKYITYIESSNGNNKELVGYLKNYSVDDSNIYLFFSDLDKLNPSHYITVISLDSLEQKNTIPIPGLDEGKIIPIYGGSGEKLIFLQEIPNLDESKKVNMISISTITEEIDYISIILDLEESAGILANANFLEEEQLIIVTDKLEIIRYDLRENNLISRQRVSDNLQNKFVTVKIHNKVLYMLYPGEDLVLYSFDLHESKIFDEIIIKDAPKNMSVFGFLINN